MEQRLPAMDLDLQIIGGGKMGEALLGGLVASGWAAAERLGVVEVDAARAADVAARFPGVAVGGEPWDGVAAIVAVGPRTLQPCSRRLVSMSIAMNALSSATSTLAPTRRLDAGDPSPSGMAFPRGS